MRICWCGNPNLVPFSPEYGECRKCGTLVYLKDIPPEQLLVLDDETDFYGKKYWLEHQLEAYGFDDIYARARNDLIERNLHWFKTLLKYSPPPARVLELGCSHGSFVALLQQAGYDASGLEMSPWVVEFGRKTFNVPIAIGPVEALDIPTGSIDAIALMDVLEHLTDPVATMAHCLQLLKPNGLLLIQTPQFKGGMNYPTLIETNDAFLEQLKPEEHLYLFSNHSVSRLFKQIGAEHIQFEPAMFGQYDMFFAVSRQSFQIKTLEEAESALLATPSGRMALALLDLRQKEEDLNQRLQESETDRAARWTQIETLTRMVKESETDHAARWTQIETLKKMLKESVTDGAARWTQIETLKKMLTESETDRAARWTQIETLKKMLTESETDWAAPVAQILSFIKKLADRNKISNE